LVVIAVISILMVALLPALHGARKHARAVTCQSNLKQWGVTLSLYTEDSQGRLPTNTGGNSGLWFLRGVFLRSDDPNANPGALHHFGTRGIACCPMATLPVQFGAGGSMTITSTSFGAERGGEFVGTPGSKFNAWEIIKPAPRFYGSYGYNGWLFRGFSLDPRYSRGRMIELDVFSLAGRSTIPVLLDSPVPEGSPMSNAARAGPPPREPIQADGVMPCCINRHSRYVNGLFLDWSVRTVGLKELWTLKWYAEFNRAGRWTKAGGAKPEDWPKWMRRFRDY